MGSIQDDQGRLITDSTKLSDEQKESLQEIKKRSYEQHTEIDTFLNEMSSKYEI